MATQRRPVSRSPHVDLAERVLSAAAGMHAGLASEGPLPSRRDVRLLVEELLEVLFPESHRLGTDGGDLRSTSRRRSSPWRPGSRRRFTWGCTAAAATRRRPPTSAGGARP